MSMITCPRNGNARRAAFMRGCAARAGDCEDARQDSCGDLRLKWALLSVSSQPGRSLQRVLDPCNSKARLREFQCEFPSRWSPYPDRAAPYGKSGHTTLHIRLARRVARRALVPKSHGRCKPAGPSKSRTARTRRRSAARQRRVLELSRPACRMLAMRCMAGSAPTRAFRITVTWRTERVRNNGTARGSWRRHPVAHHFTLCNRDDG